MSGADQHLIQLQVAEEIRRMVAEASENGGCVPTGQCAARIAKAYPGSGLAAEQIADQIIEAAIHARISVEISRPILQTGAAA